MSKAIERMRKKRRVLFALFAFLLFFFSLTRPFVSAAESLFLKNILFCRPSSIVHQAAAAWSNIEYSASLHWKRWCLLLLLLLLYQQLLNRAIHCTHSIVLSLAKKQRKVSVCCSIKSVFNQATSLFLSLSFFLAFSLICLHFLLLLLVDANAKQMPSTDRAGQAKKCLHFLVWGALMYRRCTFCKMGMHKNNAHTHFCCFLHGTEYSSSPFSPSDVNRLSGIELADRDKDGEGGRERERERETSNSAISRDEELSLHVLELAHFCPLPLPLPLLFT